MIEKRIILGYISKPVEGQKEIAFPLVKAWIRAADDIIVMPGSKAFPDSGTVFLHASALNDSLPEVDHYGLFECRHSRPGKSASWEVSGVQNGLGQVFKLREACRQPIALYQEIENYICDSVANLITGEKAYVLTSDDCLIGPYLIRNNRLQPSDRMMRWDSGKQYIIDCGDINLAFTASEILGAGQSFLPSLQDSIKRILKVISKKGVCDFLSRQHVADLATELAAPDLQEDFLWLGKDLSDWLPVLHESLELSEQFTTQILANGKISGIIESHWRADNKVRIAREEATLKSKTEAANRATEKFQSLEKTITRLSAEEEQLRKRIEIQRKNAETTFRAEIERLAADPSHLAILSSLFNRHPAAATAASATQWKRVDCSSSPDSEHGSRADKIAQNLLGLGLSIRSSNEIATVAISAFAVGQIVSIKSPLACLIAEAIHLGVGNTIYWSCEVSAGLLDPIPAPDEISDGATALVFYGANRSDYNLVVASFREGAMRQLLPGHRVLTETVFTLDSVEGLVVNQQIPFGPLIDCSLLSFTDVPGKLVKNEPRTDDSPELGLMPPEKFEELFVEAPDKLEELRKPLSMLMARRFCGAVEFHSEGTGKTKDLFFKYWLTPRLGAADATLLLSSEADFFTNNRALKGHLERRGNE